MFTQLLIVLLVGRPSALLIAGEQSVYHSVGIAADRTCEVGVVIESQSVVSDVMDAVFRFHHSSERHGLYHLLFLLAFTFVEQRVEALGYGTLRAVGLHLISEFHHKLPESL